MTNTNIQLQVFPSLHTIDCASHTGMLEMEVPALSKKVRGTSKLAICTLFLSFPSSSPRPERAAGTVPSPPVLQASWDLPRHYLIPPERLELIPPNSAWLRSCCRPLPVTLRGSDSKHSLQQRSFGSLQRALQSSKSLFCSVQQRWGF